MHVRRLTRVTETGLMHREKKFWQPTQPKCVREIQSEDLIVINLENIITFLIKTILCNMFEIYVLHYTGWLSSDMHGTLFAFRWFCIGRDCVDG